MSLSDGTTPQGGNIPLPVYYPDHSLQLAKMTGKFRTLAAASAPTAGTDPRNAVISGANLVHASLSALPFAPKLPENFSFEKPHLICIDVDVDGKKLFASASEMGSKTESMHSIITAAIKDGIAKRRQAELNLLRGIVNLRNKNLSHIIFCPDVTSDVANFTEGTRMLAGKGGDLSQLPRLKPAAAITASPDFLGSLEDSYVTNVDMANLIAEMTETSIKERALIFKDGATGYVKGFPIIERYLKSNYYSAQSYLDISKMPADSSDYLVNVSTVEHVVTVFTPKVYKLAGHAYKPMSGASVRIQNLAYQGAAYIKFNIRVVFNKDKAIITGRNALFAQDNAPIESTSGSNLTKFNSNLELCFAEIHDDAIAVVPEFNRISVLSVSGERTLNVLYNTVGVTNLNDFYTKRVKLPSQDYYENLVNLQLFLYPNNTIWKEQTTNRGLLDYVTQDDAIVYERVFGYSKPISAASSLYFNVFRDYKVKLTKAFNAPL